MTKPEGERLAVVETEIKDINKKMDQLSTDVKDIKELITDRYVAKDEFEKRLAKLETASNLWRFLSPTFAALAGSVLTFLIVEYLKKQ